MASKEVRDALRAKADKERAVGNAVLDQIIKRWNEHEEFSFTVESDWPEPPWPDAPFPRAICDEPCIVIVAGQRTEMTIREMLNIHETAAVACGQIGCKSRGGIPTNDASCDGAIAREALEFLLGKELLKPPA